MKKFLLLFLALIIITGCTIDVDFSDGDRFLVNEEIMEEIQSENKVESEVISSIGKTSSLNNPLKVGEYGIASKYNAVLDDYKDVDVAIKKIYSNPDEIVDLYNHNNPDNVILKEDGFKYVVLDYEVIFYDFETESFGTDVRIDIEVVSTSNNSFVINDVKQVIKIDILKQDLGVVNGDKGTAQVVFAIPNDVNNYLIKIGTLEHTIAYYKI